MLQATSYASSSTSSNRVEPSNEDSKSALDSTNISVFLRFEVKTSLNQYFEFLKTASKYRQIVGTMAEASASFAESLEDLAGCRGSEMNAKGFQLCADAYKSVAQRQKALCESLLKDFEIPLTKNYETHVSKVTTTEKMGNENLKKIGDEIKTLERKCSKSSSKKSKPVDYMKSLQDLNLKENELGVAKQSFYSIAIDEERRNFSFILQKISVLVKSEANAASEVAKLFEQQVYPLLGMAFSPDGKTSLPKELVDHYMSSETKTSNISVVQKVSQVGNESRTSLVVVQGTDDVKSVYEGLQERSNSANSSRSSIPGKEVTNSVSPESLPETLPPGDSTDDDYEDGEEEQVIALHNFTARDDREMSIEKGQIIKIQRQENNWIFGFCSGKSGWIPTNYTRPIPKDE